jgi:hypothetical protein
MAALAAAGRRQNAKKESEHQEKKFPKILPVQ